MSKASFGRLIRRDDLREFWDREASDFTPWLAEAENLEQLAEALHLDQLTLEATEHDVGRFSADIVARDSDGLVLIENQIEPTDHRHLGQILTYLAGLDEAATVVWIASSFLEEHRAAIDWLNANTVDRFSFFGVEVEVFQIGDALAPHFNVVAKPNDWTRDVGGRIKGIESVANNPLRQLYLDYWTGLHDYLLEHEKLARAPKPLAQQWMTFGIGKANFHINAVFQREHRTIRVELIIKGADKAAFKELQQQKNEIGQEMGAPNLSWEEMEGRKSSRVALYKHDMEISERTSWPIQFQWYAERIKDFRRVFGPRIRTLDLPSGPAGLEPE